MIEFISEDIREKFHLLPIDKQREIAGFAHGRIITLLFIDYYDGALEVSIRING